VRISGSGREWIAHARPIMGGAVAGAALGWVLSRVDLWAIAGGVRECMETPSEFCGFGAPLVGLAVGVMLTVLVCGLGFMLIGLRPLAVSVPSGIVLTGATITAYLGAVPGGRLAPTWVFTVVMTVGFTLFAMAVTPVRGLRIAGITILAILLIAAWLGERPLHDHIQNETRAGLAFSSAGGRAADDRDLLHGSSAMARISETAASGSVPAPVDRWALRSRPRQWSS
jgi:hypothetical protein